ncbi:MAG: hypothetical protein H7X95_06640 [Deltaproteobacteria bacterium]|nr:hypothetical protein [Deltaproteobacteria bacterium]
MAAEDADACGGSGSVKVYTPSDFGILRQCVRILPVTDYYLGFKYKQDAAVELQCEVSSFASADCSGVALVSEIVRGADAPNALDWMAATPKHFLSSPDARSAEVVCQCVTFFTQSVFGYFDQIYFSLNSAAF